jgi:hypothetical protein
LSEVSFLQKQEKFKSHATIKVTSKWGDVLVVIEELHHKFVTCKSYEPMEQNELMDFARQLYLREELSIVQFRCLIKELEKKGAVPPKTLEDILELT